MRMETSVDIINTSSENKLAVEPAKVVGALFWLSEQCELRCLSECAQWASEQLNHVPSSHFDEYDTHPSPQEQSPNGKLPTSKQAIVMLARTLITNRDYPRAKFILSKDKWTTSLEAFLYYFAWYMISIRNRLENDADDLDKKDEYRDEELSNLLADLESLKGKSPNLFDCFLSFLLGLVRRKNNANELAIQAFSEAIQQDNRCWPAWEALASLVDGFYVVKIENEAISKTWLYHLFVAETMFHLKLYVCAIEAYTLVSRHIGASPYVLCQIAAAQSELQEHDSAINSFQKIRKLDPYRIEQMHFYSDSLYIRQNMVELSTLAKWFYESHKFNWETCCIVGTNKQKQI